MVLRFVWPRACCVVLRSLFCDIICAKLWRNQCGDVFWKPICLSCVFMILYRERGDMVVPGGWPGKSGVLARWRCLYRVLLISFMILCGGCMLRVLLPLPVICM